MIIPFIAPIRSLSEFKARMKVGSRWFFTSSLCTGDIRVCTFVDSVCFKMASNRINAANIFCSYPLPQECGFPSSESGMRIADKHGWQVYRPLDPVADGTTTTTTTLKRR